MLEMPDDWQIPIEARVDVHLPGFAERAVAKHCTIFQ